MAGINQVCIMGQNKTNKEKTTLLKNHMGQGQRRQNQGEANSETAHA